MKRFSRLFCVLFLLMFTFSLFACKPEEEPTPTPPPGDEESEWWGMNNHFFFNKVQVATDSLMRMTGNITTSVAPEEGYAARDVLRQNENTGVYFQAPADGSPITISLDLDERKHFDRIRIEALKKDGKIVAFPKSIKIEYTREDHNGNIDFYIDEATRHVNDSGVVIPKRFQNRWWPLVELNDLQPQDYLDIRFSFVIGTHVRITITDYYQDEGVDAAALSYIGVFCDGYISTGSEEAVENATYYVSSSTGDDANDGRSEATAFKTLDRVNRLILKPGNKVLLKRGDVFENQSLQPFGQGSEEKPIVISSYGSGEQLPVIKASLAQAHGLKMINSSHYEISELEFRDSVTGIYIASDDSLTTDISVQNCKFYNITVGDNYWRSLGFENNLQMLDYSYPDQYYGSGILLVGYSSDAYIQQAIMSDILLKGNYYEGCDTGISNSINYTPYTTGWTSFPNYIPMPADGDAFRDIQIIDEVVTHSRGSGGIMLYHMTNLLIDNVDIGFTGTMGSWHGDCALQLVACIDSTVQNSRLHDTIFDNDYRIDGEGFDYEHRNKNVTMYRCQLYNNGGPAMLFNGSPIWDDSTSWNYDCKIIECDFWNNGWEGDAPYNSVFYCTRENTGAFENCRIQLAYLGQKYDLLTAAEVNMTFGNTNKVFNPPEEGGENFSGKQIFPA